MTPAAPNPDGVRSLPPPAPDAPSSPGPSSWAAPLSPPRVTAAIAHLPDVAGHDVGDAFELIWPTGAVDEQVPGDPLWVEQPQGGPEEDTVEEPAPQAVVDEPAPVPRLPERSARSVGADADTPAASDVADAPTTDARRSALKRLISGLRRR